MAEKPDDKWTLPLSAQWHRLADEAQHNHNERKWWEMVGITPLPVCIELWDARGDFEAMEQIVNFYRPTELPTISREVIS